MKLFNFFDRDNNKKRPWTEVITYKPADKYPVFLITPKATEFTRKHFKCPTLPGAALENVPDWKLQFNHLEKFFWGTAVTTARLEYHNPHSGIIFSILEDSGHYTCNYKHEEFLSFNKDAGCAIESGNCEDNPMTCTNGDFMCSPEGYSIGQCGKDSLADDCPFFKKIPRGDCRHPENQNNFVDGQAVAKMKFGFNSRCVMGRPFSDQSREQGNCFESRCSADFKTITYTIEGKEYSCGPNNKGQKIDLPTSGYYIICPEDPFAICRPELNCLNDCSMRGRCRMNLPGQQPFCECYTGFYGPDCSQKDEGCPDGCTRCDHRNHEKCSECDVDRGFSLSEEMCCPDGKVNKNGLCCLENQWNSKNKCCPQGFVNSEGLCCQDGKIKMGEDLCCDKDKEINSGGLCCPKGWEKKSSICCPPDQDESEGICCPRGKIKTGLDPSGKDLCCQKDVEFNSKGRCCPNGQDWKTTRCCPSDQIESNGGCCPVGQERSGDICCPTGQVNRGGNCCDDKCLSCSVGNSSLCPSCREGMKQIDETCCAQDEVLDDRKQCIKPDQCPTGTYADSVVSKCLPCLEKGCSKCSGGDPEDCEDCTTPFLFDQSDKKCKCPEKQFKKESDKSASCQACHTTCSTCSGAGDDKCLSCDFDRQLYGSDRQPIPNTNPEKKEGICVNCTPNEFGGDDEECGSWVLGPSEAAGTGSSPFGPPQKGIEKRILSQERRRKLSKKSDIKDKVVKANFINIRFPPKIMKLIVGSGKNFNFIQLFDVFIEGLVYGKDFTVTSELSQDKESVDLKFDFTTDKLNEKKEIRVKFSFKEGFKYYFWEKERRFPIVSYYYGPSSPQRILSEEASGTSTPKTRQQSASSEVQTQEEPKTDVKTRVIVDEDLVKTINDSIKDISRFASAAQILILLIPVVYFIGLLMIPCFKMEDFIARNLKALIDIQILAKVALINIDRGPLLEVFFSYIFSTDSVWFRHLKTEPSDFKYKTSGLFYLNEVPLLTINSALISTLLFLVGFVGFIIMTIKIRRKHSKSSKDKKAFIFLAGLMSLKIVEVFFYSMYSVFYQPLRHTPTIAKLSYLKSIVSLILSAFSLLFAYHYINKFTREKSKTTKKYHWIKDWLKDDMTQANIKTMIFLAVIILMQRFGKVIVISLAVTQGFFCVLRGFLFKSGKKMSRQTLAKALFNLLTEVLLFAFLLMFLVMSLMSLEWESRTLMSCAKLTIVTSLLYILSSSFGYEIWSFVDRLRSKKNKVGHRNSEKKNRESQNAGSPFKRAQMEEIKLKGSAAEKASGKAVKSKSKTALNLKFAKF